MKKILILVIFAVFALTCVTVLADDGALAYAEIAPGGEVATVEELIQAFGESSYGDANAELLPGSQTEVRLKSSVILQSTLVIKSGSYTIVGGGCTIARSDECGNAIDVQGGSLAFERADSLAEFGDGVDPNIILNGQNKEGKAFINVSSSGTLIFNSRVLAKNISSSENGGVIYAHGDAKIEIYASRFENCRSKNGGAIYISKSSDDEKRPLKIQKSRFVSCFAENGGVIYSEGYVYISDSVLNENTATFCGGAMYLYGNSELQNISADENKAENGAVLFNGGVSVMVAPNAFYNEAKNGGVIYNKNSCLVSDIYFFENKASDCGGAIYNEGAFYLNSGSLMANESVRYGGGVYSSDSSVFKMEKGEITSCKSEYAGGIYSAGDLIMVGGAVVQNKGNAPHIAVFGNMEMSDYAVCYNGDVIGLIQKSDGSYPFINLKSVLKNPRSQRVALYKLTNGTFKPSNTSGVTVFKGSADAIASALTVFDVHGGGVFPYKLSKNGEMKRAFPTVLVIVSASALAVGAVGFVVGKKVVKVKREL